MKAVLYMTGIIIGAIIAFYLVIVLYVYAMQDKMLFYPTFQIETTPAQSGLAFEDVYFETEDGVKLHAWYIPVDTPTATLIFCHGNGGNISHRIESIEQFHALNLSVFIFDYRGYGNSEGKISEEGTYLDAAAAWTYLTTEKQIAPDNIISFGRSLGGGIASWLAVNRQVKALILESTFTSISDVGKSHYPIIPVKLISRYDYNSIEKVEQLTLPKLFIHSRTDEIVPFKLGRKLFERASEPKEFLEISGGHNDGYLMSHESYIKTMRQFLDSVFR